ncbi:terpene synthase family protein [Actinomadura rubrisoli]|uniref:Terpene synthase n=1 Tax=Actinomadura rubrisoli TaxID=2530368 RepID=A0A4R5CAI1_9ACTN|nr:sesquiterpene cyclase [Actinomadura rubrisoli]TDD96335.1 sesquiterpene cyclase [Actinomadura rubrisoli]
MNVPIELAEIEPPRFEFPWPSACHPQALAVDEQMIAWGRAHDLIPDEVYLERVIRTRYGYLAARCYPHADTELLQIIADYFLWFFLADDLFVDRVQTVTPDTLTNLTAMIDVLDYDRSRPLPVYGESAWLDVCRRLRARLSAEQFERFATGIRLWASTAGLQMLDHLQRRPIAMGDYETIRRYASGMTPSLALPDAANQAHLTAEEYHHPTLHRLRMHTNNVVCWSNDIHSLQVEARQPGQFRNMVTLYAAQGQTLREAVDTTAGRVRVEIDAFLRSAQPAQQTASPALFKYIEGLKDWMRGYQDWYDHDTQRYATAHAEQDADDRDTLTS